MDHEELLSTVTALGASLLENGAEIYRVEESMNLLYAAYGEKGEVFVIPSCIFSSISAGEGRTFTKTKRVSPRGANFDRIAALNDLCRRVCSTTPPLSQVRRELDEINHRAFFPFLWQVFGSALVAFAFTLLFNGSLADAICSIPAAVLVKLLTRGMEKAHTNSFFTYIAGSALGAFIALAAVALGLGQHHDRIIIGVFMNLVPGMAMTNAIRDIIAGDLLSGIFKIVEALMVGLAIAIGAGLAISFSRVFWGVG